MLRRAWLAAFMLVSIASAPALAQDKKAADALFKEGRAAFDKGDYTTACKKFDESQKADPAVGTLLNLAVCEEKSGKLSRAKKHLDEVLVSLPAKDDRIQLAKELAGSIEVRLAWITLTLAPGAPASTTVKHAEDGTTIALGTPTAMDPGEHSFIVTSEGQPETRLKLTLAEGKRETRTVGTAAAAPPPPPQESSTGSGKLRRTIGFAVGGLGVVGIGVAAITGVVLLGKKSDMDEQCPAQRCNAAGLKLLDENKNTALVPVNTVGWIVGITGVTAGAVLVLTSGLGEQQTKTAIGPTMIGTGAGLGAAGSF